MLEGVSTNIDILLSVFCSPVLDKGPNHTASKFHNRRTSVTSAEGGFSGNYAGTMQWDDPYVATMSRHLILSR
jgi:hypothetical protein